MSVLVACIGNIFQGDDAFGCEVAKLLNPGPNVRVVDYGIRGLDLTYALLDRPELTIFVDAIQRGGEPGTLYLVEPDLDDLNEGELGIDPHSMDPLRVLRTVKAMGGSLGRILIIGCEPGDLGGDEGRMGLTPPVAAALDEAARMVEEVILKEREKIAA